MREETVKGEAVYSLRLSGISCTNCASNIENMLRAQLADETALLRVNVMSEQLQLTTRSPHTLPHVLEVLRASKYKPVGEPVLLNAPTSHRRTATFTIASASSAEELAEGLGERSGVTECRLLQAGGVRVEYNPSVVRGWELAELVARHDPDYRVRNERVEALKDRKAEGGEQQGIRVVVGLCLYFFLANAVFPVLPLTEAFYSECMQFPSQFGVYSLAVIFNILLTLHVMDTYSRRYIAAAYRMYRDHGATNMQTLIALGSLSSFALSLFLLGKYSYQSYSGQLRHKHLAIMHVNQALTSASIIVLVVTLGKHFEARAKRNIARMTEALFPTSALFSDMAATLVQVKNRKLMAASEREVDVVLVEKEDVVRVRPGRLLLDVMVMKGTATATQSTRTGSEDRLQVGRGERLESGSEIHEAEECYAIVEKPIEQSLLVELATHVRFSQNQSQGQESGIEALCQNIASRFVKAVVLLSLATMAVWTVVLANYDLDIPICDACWVVERGIGVLVASCPCALGLAVPSVIAIVLNLATKSGILIKNNSVFEKMKNANKIAFDKTGTLFTRINAMVGHKRLTEETAEKELWELVALLERRVRHPLAEAIYREALERSGVVGASYGWLLVGEVCLVRGGVRARAVKKSTQEEMTILIGNGRLMASEGVEGVPEVSHSHSGATHLFLSINGRAVMMLSFNTHSDLRPECKLALDGLRHEQGLDIYIVSGDSRQSLQRLGESLSLPQHCLVAECTPEEKQQWVRENQRDRDQTVLMVGDGLNDIPCLQEAGIGISINAKSELNINAADVVLLSENLHKVVALLRFLKRGNLFVRINLAWAFLYNISAMPIVAGALYHWGVVLSPVWSSVAMCVSSLLVVGFSHLLLLFHYDDSLTEAQPESSPIPSQSTTRETIQHMGLVEELQPPRSP